MPSFKPNAPRALQASRIAVLMGASALLSTLALAPAHAQTGGTSAPAHAGDAASGVNPADTPKVTPGVKPAGAPTPDEVNRAAKGAPAAAPQQHNLHRDNRRRDARGEDHGGSAVDLTDSMQSQRGTSAEDCVGRGRAPQGGAARVQVGVRADVSACCFNFYLDVSAPMRRVRGSVRRHTRCDASRTCSRGAHTVT